MKRNIWTRLLALGLAACSLFVLAAALSADKNNDGKINSWDMQLAVSEDPTQDFSDMIVAVLGGQDDKKPNAEGVYEIYNTFTLFNMANYPDATFRLMDDLDLSGIVWTPVENFQGTFDGNNKTITGLTIHSDRENVGLFANMGENAVVMNLTLQDVVLTAGKDAKYLGAVAGTCSGTITNVDVIGRIYDTRETTDEKVYYGALAGYATAGTVSGGTGVSVTDGAEKYTTTGLCADMKVLTNLPLEKIQKGVAARSEAGATVSGIFCDSSYATTLLSEAEQTKRETVVNNMYQQGTVEWTPSETIYYVRTYSNNGKDDSEHAHSNAYIAGRTYTGIPYNHGAGSLERFMSQMQEDTDSQGRLVTKTGLESGRYYTDGRADMLTGFIQYMGTDCSSSIGWAWATVSPAKMDDPNYTGTYLHLCRWMVPNAYNQQKYGVYPVGNYQMPETNAEKYTAYADVRNTQEIILLNGAQAMAEAYAQAHRGDALVFNTTKASDGEDSVLLQDEGHSRMIAEDPVVIRNADGTIDLDKSYMITHEQGDGLGDVKDQNGNYISNYDSTKRSGTGWISDTYYIKYTSWRINHKYNFNMLLTEEGENAAREAYKNGDNDMRPGCGWGYIPITMKAFEKTRTPYISKDSSQPIVAPNSGRLYSNYRTISATLVVKDASGKEIYNETRYNGVGAQNGQYRNTCMYTSLTNLFPDSVDNCVAGQTYTYTVKLYFSDGTSKVFTPDNAYTHPAAE